VVNATSLSGTFATVNASGSVPTALNPQVSYTNTSANLVLTGATTTTTTPPPVTPPPVRVAPVDGSLYGNLMRSVNLSGQQALSSILNVSPALIGADCGQQPLMQNVTASSCHSGAWAQYSGSSLSLDGSNGLNSTGFGLLGGADYAVGDALHLGVEAGVGRINDNDSSGGNGRVDNAHAGLYAYANAGPLVLSATVDGMHSSYRVNRATGIGAANATPDGNTVSAALQAAWPLQLSAWQLTPQAGALYQRQQLGGFSESIGGTNPLAPDFAVTGARSSYIVLQPYADVSITRAFQAQGVTYLPQFSVGYRYNTRNAAPPTVQVTAQDGTLFTLPGATSGRGMATADARITAEAGAMWNLYVDYQGLFASRLHDNALSVGFTKRF
jgi:fibronectin-binding autotransporter adhesin